MSEEEKVKELQETVRVYEGYYFSYSIVSNGWEGYYPVNLTFNQDEKWLRKLVTGMDRQGRFTGPFHERKWRTWNANCVFSGSTVWRLVELAVY